MNTFECRSCKRQFQTQAPLCPVNSAHIVMLIGSTQPSFFPARIRLAKNVLPLNVGDTFAAQNRLARDAPLMKAEGADPSAPTSANSGEWTDSDRENCTPRWQAACLFNLKMNNFRRYTRIIERRDFYRWFYKYSIDQGCETRWALAASVVATGAYEVAIMKPVTEDVSRMAGIISNEVQGMLREGNQVIFDNVFPKLRELLVLKPKGRRAFEWDMRTLSEEQTLIQPLYKGVSQAAFDQLNRIARLQGLVGAAAVFSPSSEVREELPYVKGGEVPAFTGTSLTSIDDRWDYGMRLGDIFTPGGTGYALSGDRRPIVSAGYLNGTELSRVRTRPNLHRLDAAFDEGSVGPHWLIQEVDALLRRLTPAEQVEFLRDQRPDGGDYSTACRIGASYKTLLSMLSTWRVSLEAQMRFLSRYIGGDNDGPWRDMEYKEIAPIIRPFSQSEKNQLHTLEWRRIFILVCDDATMKEAVRDLGLPEPLRTQWITEEERWF